MTTTTAVKVFTHDLCPPVQGGDPVWDGKIPFKLPRVEVDNGPADCGRGWNACETIDQALLITHFWPNGRPARVFTVKTPADVVKRGDKWRASTWTIASEISDAEIEAAIGRVSAKWFPSEFLEEMVEQQVLWRRALARPERDEEAVEVGLREALIARDLKNWKLQRFETAWAARAARDAWDARDARDARAAWDARDAWAARDARAARAARDAWDARDAWAARAAWAARDAWDAWDARDALTFYYAARRHFVDGGAPLLTTGIREAYYSGLDIVVPVAANTLGYAMVEPKK